LEDPRTAELDHSHFAELGSLAAHCVVHLGGERQLAKDHREWGACIRPDLLIDRVSAFSGPPGERGNQSRDNEAVDLESDVELEAVELVHRPDVSSEHEVRVLMKRSIALGAVKLREGFAVLFSTVFIFSMCLAWVVRHATSITYLCSTLA
jgi:hypothetical protein